MAFPDVLADCTTEALLDVFEAGPKRLREALAGLDGRDLMSRPLAGKWSALEIAAHLADSETMGAGRIRKVIAEPGSTLAVYDESRWATALDYQHLPSAGVTEVVNLFSALRSATTRLLRGLAPADWSKTGLHPEWGAVTVRQLLELYADHSERHLAQIEQRRVALGRPATFSPLLTARLY